MRVHFSTELLLSGRQLLFHRIGTRTCSTCRVLLDPASATTNGGPDQGTLDFQQGGVNDILGCQPYHKLLWISLGVLESFYPLIDKAFYSHGLNQIHLFNLLHLPRSTLAIQI